MREERQIGEHKRVRENGPLGSQSMRDVGSGHELLNSSLPVTGREDAFGEMSRGVIRLHARQVLNTYGDK